MTDVLKKVAYTTEATAKGGRTGHVTSADGVLDLDLDRPNPQNPTPNPETLFAAGYAACFQGALENRAKTKDVDTSESTVTAKVSLGDTDDGGVGLAVELAVHIPGIELDQARELVELAHQFCPYSKATRNNIEVTLTVE
ncbi:organic hydroperoxide resistance protein [uncultured Jatrophihabitans sp.]|uniref:organic hydroperoxide resistance protein n=1 Tax=uncultured Jatrophihabitans sp. TaxID=1610747 RepID=UPI0035C9F626